MTPNYNRAVTAATALLLSQPVRRLKLDVTKLRYSQTIIFDTFERFCAMSRLTPQRLGAGSDCLRDGCTIVRKRDNSMCYIVLYDHCQNKRRQAFTLAHEVGHIVLGHKTDEDLQEKEANCFAGQLLAPMVLVNALARRSPWPLTPQDLCGVFSISAQAAENRLKELVRPHRFTADDAALLDIYAHLLPHSDEPIVSFI